MANERLRTIMLSGGDYTDLVAAEAGEQGNLVTADEYLVLEYRGDWSSAPDTGSVVIDGSTTDATRYIEVRTDSANRHAGAWDANKAVLVGDAAAAVIRVADANVFLRGLQIETNATATYGIGGTSGAFEVDSCLIDASAGAANGCLGVTGSSTSVLTAKNVATKGGDAGFFRGTNGSANLYNCTLYGAALGIEGSTTAVTLINSLLQGNTADVDGTLNAASDYNCDEDGSAPGANSITETASFVSAAAFDLHLAAALSAQGTDLSGSGVTTDFEGDARSATPDIGADERAGSGWSNPPAGTTRVLGQFRRMQRAA